jgi:phosphatidyl-myo-inositol dimannoside synthase
MTTRDKRHRILGLFPELLGTGGIQEAGRLTAAALAEIAARHGWVCDFLSLNDAAGVQEFDIGRGPLKLQGYARSKGRFVAGAAQRAGRGTRIVLAAHPNLALAARCAGLFRPGLRTMVMSHGVDVWTPLPTLRRGALLHADLLLAPSRDTAQKLKMVQGAPANKIRRLPWPLSPSFMAMTESAEQLPLPASFPSGRVILSVGRWDASERYKGADDLIRTAAQFRLEFPDVHLVAVGDGSDLARLQSLSSELNLGGVVHFLSRLSRAEIAACYKHADVFALPSTGEGFGIVFVEAMAFAKPVLGAACGGSTDIIEDGCNGLLVPPHDFGALVEALRRLLADAGLRERLGRQGAEMVRNQYQFGVFESSLEQLLEEAGLRSR